MTAKNSFGTELWMVASGGTLAKIAGVLDVSPPEFSRATIDATAHDSTGGASEKITSGYYDIGEISGQMLYVAGSTGDDAFLTAITGGALYDFKIVVKASTGTEDMTFSGYVTKYKVDALPIDGKQTASFSIQPTSVVTQAASV